MSTLFDLSTFTDPTAEDVPAFLRQPVKQTIHCQYRGPDCRGGGPIKPGRRSAFDLLAEQFGPYRGRADDGSYRFGGYRIWVGQMPLLMQLI